MTIEEMIVAYRNAYRAANGREIEVAYSRGWFAIGPAARQSRFRKGSMASMTRTLLLRAASRIEAGTDETAKQGSARRAKAGKDARKDIA